MPNKNIEQFNPDLNLNGNENLLAMDNGTTVRIPLNSVKTYVNEGSHDYYTTGVTINDKVLVFDRNDSLSAYTVDLSGIGGASNEWHIPSGTTVVIESNKQTFIYGDLYIEGTLLLDVNSQLVVLNGDVILDGGIISGDGTTLLVDLPEINTYTETARLVNNTLHFDTTDGLSTYTVDLSPLIFTGNTLPTNINQIYVSNLKSPSVLTVHGKLQQNGNTASGTGNNVALGSNSTANGNTSFIHSTNSTVSGARSAVLGGQNITGSANDTVYVPNLNINTIPSTNNGLTGVLVRDSDGSIRLRDSSSLGGAISYNRILVVDPVYGNNGTGVPDRFDRPYASVSQALSVANGLTKSIWNRILIYVRAGQYSGQYMFLKDNVDIYCEPGVTFIHGTRITDAFEVGPVNSRFLGYAKFDNLSYTGSPLIGIQKASNVILEFDSINYISTILFCADVTASGTTSEVVLKCNRIESTQTLGAAWAINCRNNTNVRIIVSDYIKANHNILYFRTSFYGKAIIDCPKIILTATNLYGANYDHCVLVESSALGSKIIINGDLYSEKLSFGGNASCLLVNGGGNCDVEFNGNIYGNNSVGVWLNMTTSTGKIKINGDIKSAIRPIILVGTGNAHFKNSNIVLASATTYDAMIYTNHTGNVFFTNCSFNAEKADTHTFLADGTTGTIMISNSNSYTAGSNGEFFHSNAGAMTLKTHNVRANKPLGVNITDLLTPSGFIQDSNIITPNF
jgi:hypothetical protein